jgi:hypothetical protein
MEIQALTLAVSEKDLNDLAARHMPEALPLEELRFRLTADGLQVSGEYPLFLRVTFETHWQLGVRDGDVTARLVRFKALGLPVPVFKSVLLKLLKEAARKEDWVHFDGDDTVVVRVDRMLEGEGFPLRTNLCSIRCHDQGLVVEARAPGLAARSASA